MLTYTTPEGLVHTNLTNEQAMQMFAKNSYTGKIERQEAPSTALVVEPIARSFGLTRNPSIHVIDAHEVEEPIRPVSPRPGGVQEEYDQENMRSRNFRSARDKFVTKSLEEVLANLEDQKKREDPKDITRRLTSMKISFDDSVPQGQFIGQSDGEPIIFNRRAFRQLCTSVCGTGSVRMIDRALKLNQGDKLAALVINAFRQESTAVHQFRTALDMNGKRRVNAMLSDSYGVYDNVDFIKDTIMCLEEDINEWHVVRYHNRDGRMYTQLVHVNDIYLNREVGKPVPAMILRNGQFGDSSCSVSGGTYKLDCSNGMFSVTGTNIRRWNHSGNTSTNVTKKLPDAIDDIRISANGLIEADQQALATEIDNAFEFYNQAVGDAHSDTFKEHVQWTMLNEPTVRGNGRLLTSIPDSLTFLAQEQADLGRQAELELLAGQLLHQGLGQAVNNRIHVPLV